MDTTQPPSPLFDLHQTEQVIQTLHLLVEALEADYYQQLRRRQQLQLPGIPQPPEQPLFDDPVPF